MSKFPTNFTSEKSNHENTYNSHGINYGTYNKLDGSIKPSFIAIQNKQNKKC
jgi:hypothetical protein